MAGQRGRCGGRQRWLDGSRGDRSFGLGGARSGPALDFRRRLLRLLVATKPLAVRLPANTISLGILDARRVARDPDAQTEAEV
jgi:hypothetical protein